MTQTQRGPRQFGNSRGPKGERALQYQPRNTRVASIARQSTRVACLVAGMAIFYAAWIALTLMWIG